MSQNPDASPNPADNLPYHPDPPKKELTAAQRLRKAKTQLRQVAKLVHDLPPLNGASEEQRLLVASVIEGLKGVFTQLSADITKVSKQVEKK